VPVSKPYQKSKITIFRKDLVRWFLVVTVFFIQKTKQNEFVDVIVGSTQIDKWNELATLPYHHYKECRTEYIVCRYIIHMYVEFQFVFCLYIAKNLLRALKVQFSKRIQALPWRCGLGSHRNLRSRRRKY
jgi:hypothetical protein